MPAYTRDRLRLPTPVVSTEQPTALSLVRLLEERGEKKFRGLSQPAAEAAVAALNPADGHETLFLLRALRHDGHTGPRDMLVRRIDPARVDAYEPVLCQLAEELGPGPQSGTLLARVVVAVGPVHYDFHRDVVIPALQATRNHELLVQLAERIRDTGNFDAYLSLVPAQQEKYRYGREPDGSPSTAWSWASLP